MYISPSGQYPLYYGDIQIEHPNWQLGDPLPNGWREVKEAPLPVIGDDETFEENAPIEQDGELYQSFSVRKLTTQELAIRNAPRTAKEKLLALGLTEYEIQALRYGVL